MKKIKIGISSCLMGNQVRFDGGHKRNAYINSVLTRYFDFVAFCPEIDIGLGTPRSTLRLVRLDDETRCKGVRNPALDVTEKLYRSADRQASWQRHLSGYILKKDSPSCGMERVRLYRDDIPTRDGVGLYAERLMKNFPALPVEEEGRLQDPLLRENFIRRVYIYRRWQDMTSQQPGLNDLNRFHARHKHIYMSHNQGLARQLGSWLAENQKTDLPSLADRYLNKMTALLKHTATRRNHVNSLQHIQGYLKKRLSAADRSELTVTIDRYRRGLLPLIVPVTLLRHHFRHHPNDYIRDSFYMEPHPEDLMLLNHL